MDKQRNSLNKGESGGLSEKNNIETEDVIKEMESHKSFIDDNREQLKKNRVPKILTKLLNEIEPINFQEYCKLEGDSTKLQKKHYLVTTVEMLLNTAKNKGFSLCRKNGLIYLFNSEYWESIEQESFKDFLSKAALKSGVDKFNAKYHEFKDNLFKQFLADAGLEEIKPNNDTTLINLRNGTFEITPKIQILREFRESDFLTYQLPFAYDENAEAPKFQAFLDDVLPEKELQAILAEYIGYIFIKNNAVKFEKVMFLYGTGANGKSVVFDIISALLGKQNITNYSLQSLTDENSKSRINIVGKLLNYSSEISGKLDSATFKQMATGEALEIPVLYKQSITTTDYAKLMFNCNALPKEVENTLAFFRRFIILPFRVTIPEHKQDKTLSHYIINNELSGVFNWVLQGLSRLLENQNFTTSKIVEEEVLQYQKESDSVLLFLEEERYQPSMVERENRKSIFHDYQQFCRENGNHPFSATNFYKRLKAQGYKGQCSNSVRYIYIERKS